MIFNFNNILQFVIWTFSGLVMTLTFFPRASAASDLQATSRRETIVFETSAECNTGEGVLISGTIHLVSQTQADGSMVSHINYENMTGVGLTSGTIYRFSGVDNVRLRAPFPSSINSVRNFHLISPGSDSNLLLTVLFHVTVNANGEVTVTIRDTRSRCT
jgi:hypothetical protein